MENETGGYCPQCDTVWAAPGKCNCDPLLKKHSSAVDAMNIVTWNEAIEEAAQFNDSCGYNLMAKEIRKLKK